MIAWLKLRYKKPDADKSVMIEFPVEDKVTALHKSKDLQFASAVAGFAMLLRDSKYKGNLSYDKVLELAKLGKGEDPHGYRAEFMELVEKAGDLSDRD